MLRMLRTVRGNYCRCWHASAAAGRVGGRSECINLGTNQKLVKGTEAMLSKLDTNKPRSTSNYRGHIGVGWHGALSKPLHQYVERRAACFAMKGIFRLV